MVCVNHGTRDGVNTCSKCGSWLCEDCTVDIDGRIVCKKCVAQLLASNGGKHHGPAAVEKHVHHYEHRVHSGACEKSEKRRISRLLLLLFSFTLPGINYMFMGLMKRGVYALAAFATLFYFAVELNAPLFGIVAGVVYLVSFFDGFHVRRKLINHEYVEDGFSGITNALYRHKLPLGILTLFIVLSSVISNVAHRNFYRYSYYSGSDFAPVIFIVLVIAAVFFFFIRPLKKSKKDAESRTDVIDKTDYDN